MGLRHSWYLTLCWACAGVCAAAAERELIRDPHFQGGFYLLEPRPGQRVVYGELSGFATGKTVWDLAQWSSRFPLHPTNCAVASELISCGNIAKRVQVGHVARSANVGLGLAVNASAEYPQPRKSAAEPWVHLLVQQEFQTAPFLGELNALRFHLQARLTRSKLTNTNGYSPGVHAAQYLAYITVGNRNSKSPGYQECFWFGVPIYDNRERFASAYEAQDFGDTKLFIFTPGAQRFAKQSTHDGQWVTFAADLLPLMREGLEHAHAKGFIKGSKDPADFRPLGIFIGWEVPGTFDVELQIRELSLKAGKRAD